MLRRSTSKLSSKCSDDLGTPFINCEAHSLFFFRLSNVQLSLIFCFFSSEDLRSKLRKSSCEDFIPLRDFFPKGKKFPRKGEIQLFLQHYILVLIGRYIESQGLKVLSLQKVSL